MSLNVVPNVYNSLQRSFLSLAWPWSGMSLPRETSGIDGTWKGALAGLGEVGHSPGEPVLGPWTGPNVVGLPVHLPPQCSLTLPTSLPTSWCSLHPLMPIHPCQWDCCDPVLGYNVVSLPVHLPIPMPLTPPTPPANCWCPYIPDSPSCPLHPCQWECCDPVLGSNVVSLPVHLPPQYPLTPSSDSLTPLNPHAPYTLSLGVLWPCTGVHCGQPPQSTCHPNAPKHLLQLLTPLWCPYILTLCWPKPYTPSTPMLP